jgi:phosphate transport system protein
MGNLLDERLDRLNRELIEMGALIEHAIESASQALIDQDVNAAAKAIAFDQEVDQKERDIEALCMKLLLKQQPVARDLRLISAALKMITDMERIGDQAADISGLVIYLAGKPYIKKLEHLTQMAASTIRMVTGAVDAFVKRDLILARQIIEMDDVIDDLFDIVKYELIECIRVDAASGEQAVDLLMIAKYFERIGDHAQNIAEWVEYALTGRHKGEPL